MTIEQIKEMVNGSAYDFLRTNEHLGRKIIFLTLGGSYSYGTNVETSELNHLRVDTRFLKTAALFSIQMRVRERI